MRLEKTVIEPLTRGLSRRARVFLALISVRTAWSLHKQPDGSVSGYSRADYPQTCLMWTTAYHAVMPWSGGAYSFWWHVNKFIVRKLYKPPIYLLCRILIGHELSETEKGYGGGITEDRHCRWCDKVFQVPAGDFAREWGGEIKRSLCGF